MPIKLQIWDSHETGNVSINSLKKKRKFKKPFDLQNCHNGSTAFGLEAPARGAHP